MLKILIRFVPGLVAACLGGVVGYFLFRWIYLQGFYALVIPGALAGLACGLLSVDQSWVRGAICAGIAFMAGVASKWMLFLPPVETDGSLIQYLTCFQKQPPLTLIMVGLGTALGFWWGRESTFPWRHRFARSIKSGEADLD